MKIVKILFGLFVIACIFYSCRCSCWCRKDLGCITMIATSNHTGDTLIVKKYCSSQNFTTDKQLADSTHAFYAKYLTDTSNVYTRDSIYEYNYVDDLKCNQTDSYTDKGFGCACAK